MAGGGALETRSAPRHKRFSGEVLALGSLGVLGNDGGAEGVAHAGRGLGLCPWLWCRCSEEQVGPSRALQLEQLQGGGQEVAGGSALSPLASVTGSATRVGGDAAGCCLTAGSGRHPPVQLRFRAVVWAERWVHLGRVGGSGWIVQWGEAKRGQRGEEPAPLCCAERGARAHPLPTCSAPLGRPEALLIVVCLALSQLFPGQRFAPGEARLAGVAQG